MISLFDIFPQIANVHFRNDFGFSAGPNAQNHHLIPSAVANQSSMLKLLSWFGEQGDNDPNEYYSHNDRINSAPLFTDPQKADELGTAVHSGSHPNYSERLVKPTIVRLGDELQDRIATKYNNLIIEGDPYPAKTIREGQWIKDILKEFGLEIRGIQSELHSGLYADKRDDGKFRPRFTLNGLDLNNGPENTAEAYDIISINDGLRPSDPESAYQKGKSGTYSREFARLDKLNSKGELLSASERAAYRDSDFGVKARLSGANDRASEISIVKNIESHVTGGLGGVLAIGAVVIEAGLWIKGQIDKGRTFDDIFHDLKESIDGDAIMAAGTALAVGALTTAAVWLVLGPVGVAALAAFEVATNWVDFKQAVKDLADAMPHWAFIQSVYDFMNEVDAPARYLNDRIKSGIAGLATTAQNLVDVFMESLPRAQFADGALVLKGRAELDLMVGDDAAVLQGLAGNDWLVHRGFGRIEGGDGHDIVVGWMPELIKPGEAIERATREAEKAGKSEEEYQTLVADYEHARQQYLHDLALWVEDGRLGAEPTPPASMKVQRAIEEERLVLQGQAGNDWVVAIGGEGAVIDGGPGDDVIVNGSRDGTLWGGQGKDTFVVTSNTVIADAEVQDRVLAFGVPLYGGVKQWWMEGNTAYWAPFSSVMTAFPVIGSSVLTTAAFFIDAVTMKFAAYQRNASGDLEISIGWGLGGKTYLKDYSLDLDSGVGNGGITVFQHEWAEDYSFENLKQYVNLALKAGFGIGLGKADPLILDLDDDGFELTTDEHSKVYFEFDDDGFAERTGWVRRDDGLLVLDANLNGVVDGLGELFGSQTTAGFAELATHDTNADGIIDVSDAVYAQLRVWQDHDQDGETDAGELNTLGELGITAVGLANSAPTEPTEIGGNTVARLGSFTRNGQTHDIADVAFEIDQMRTRWHGDGTVSAVAAALPDILGRGELKNLRVAMTDDAALLALVDDFAANPATDLAELKADAEAILYAWADVAAIPADALGTDGFDERKLAFLEKYSGLELMPRDGSGDVQITNLAEMEALWDDQVMRLTLRLVVQGPLADRFDGISYNQRYDLLVAETPTALGEVYASLLEDLPSDPEDALALWEEWAPLLAAMAEGMVRHDNNLVRGDFLAAQLLAAMDGIVQPLSFVQLTTALGIENLRIGTTSNETLSRGAAEGAAIYLPGGGNDTINGAGGQDVYIFGRTIGQVVINDSEGNPAGDRIRFAFLNPSQVTLSRNGDDLVIAIATSESIRVTGQFADVVPLSSDVLLSANRGVEEIQFADGTIFEIPDIMIAVGKGTSGNDHLIGTMHSDALQGGLGNDRMEGGDDADLYVVNAGEGQDVIRDVQSTPLLRAADMLIFGDDIAPGELSFSRSGTNGKDLMIAVGASGQSVLIEEQFAYTSIGYNHKWSPNSRIEAFGFREYGDGWSNRDLQQMMIAQVTTDGNDIALGFGDDDAFGASAGNDIMKGLDGADTYAWGAGFGNDVIDEQAEYIDVTVGLGGISLTVRADTVVFAPDLHPDDVVFSRLSSAPDLTVTITATGETLTVRNQFDGFQTGPLGAQWFDRVEWFEFGDGTRLSWQDVLLAVTTGGAGNDSLWGDLYQDTLSGGAGNDYLSGGGYADLYRFGPGDGQDVLEDNNDFILGAGFVTVDATPDILKFGEGVDPANVSVEHAGADLLLKVDGSTDQVTLRNQDDYFHTGVFGAFNRDRIERVEFHDGTVWTWQDLNSRAIANATTSGNDVINGFMMADRFEASAGNDVMKGGDSGDTYVFGEGAGHDIIRETVSNIYYGDHDVVEFAAGIAPEDVELSHDGNDLIITLTTTGETLTIENQFRYAAWFVWNDIEEFRFTDGTVWTIADVTGPLLEGTSGADTIVGFDSNDTIDGKQGNDILRGGNGADRYVFAEGYGKDTIREGVDNTNVGDNDRLILMDLNKSDVTFSRESDDLIISINGTDDTVRIEKQFHLSTLYLWHDIENFEFADGVLSARDVASILLAGTPGNDILSGTIWSDVLDGGAGNDLLKGGDGSDIYVYDVGYGNDVIEEYVSSPNISDNDSLHFGAGIALENLSFSRDGEDLVITIDATAETLTILEQLGNQAWYTWYDIENFVFVDGTVLTRGDVEQILLTGGEGNDTLIGFANADVLDGKGGNDHLYGKDGPDTYHFGIGYGNDVIHEDVDDVNLSDNDTLRFGEGIVWDDLVFTRSGDHLTIGIEGTLDTIKILGQLNTAGDTVSYTWSDVENFVFSDGTTKTKSHVFAALLQSTDGDDNITGFYTNDAIIGGLGNDTMNGGRGSDIFVHNIGDGHDLVADYFDYWGSENDKVVFGAGITPDDVEVVRSSAADIRMNVFGGQSSVTLKNQATGNGEWTIDSVVFANGVSWSPSQIAARLANPGTAAADQISGTYWADQIDGLDGNDNIQGGSGNDLLRGGSGNDTVVGDAGDDVIIGGPGNDSLQGGSNIDTYVYELGDGEDVIFDASYDSSPDEILQFGAGISASSLVLSNVAGDWDDIRIGFIGQAGSIVLDEQMGDSGIERIEFSDGTAWDETVLFSRYVSDQKTAGNDTINGTNLNDTIVGGGGNDTLIGGNGADLYRFGLGDGQDIVRDTGNGVDTLELGEGISPNDIAVAQADGGNDLVLIIAGTTDQITLDQTINNASYRIEQVRFFNGTVWTAAELLARATGGTNGNDNLQGGSTADTLSGGAGNDVIDGRDGNDTLVGGSGNDTLHGGNGNDSYLFERGDGQDIIRERNYSYGGNDTLEFGEGIAPGEILVTQGDGGNDFVLKIAGTTDQITIDQTINDPNNRVEQVRFADGTVWNYADLLARSIAVICPLLSGPKSRLFWIMKELGNGQEAQAGRDHRQAA